MAKLARVDLVLIAFTSACLLVSVVGVIYILDRREKKSESASVSSPVSASSTTSVLCAEGYRFDSDRGCFKPSVLAQPGVGIGSIAVGKSSPDDVLRAFGSDCKVNRHSDGRVFGISYDYDGDGKYEASRRANHKRPGNFAFKDDVLQTMSIGVYQQDIATPGGLSSSSTKAQMLGEFGDHFDFVPGATLEKYIYRDKGIEVWVSKDDQTVNSFIIRIPQKD